ncbi:MAG TPA: squalene--hopene cyclase [Candidatus Dormibacteraeota bacterium]|jgi:squalene-hopene/tetraprenyl-beta-curcumene cyclase|nr:squalene--hopene cyclase [Candidatus Dormibacteraeota bacterium]
MASVVRIGEQVPAAPASLPWHQQDWAEKLPDSIERGAEHLISLQADEGYWVGELEADSTLESDYIYYLHVLGKADPVRIAKLANYVRRKQLPDGGWNIYPGGPSELNATCKAYFALKLAGDNADAPHLAKARAVIHRLGGLEHTNSYVRFYLALVGVVGWDLVPAIPPEMMLLPDWFALNIYEMSSWTRGIVIPLAILSALRPDWRVPESAHVDELFKDSSHKAAAFDWSDKLISWKNFFLALDRGFKLYEKSPWKPLRQRALREAKQWMLEHMERSEGVAAIYPAMMNSIFALIALGHGPEDPLPWREIKEFSKFEIEENDTIRMQPCVSPIWDTCIAMVALEEAGVEPDHPTLVKAADWILSKQILGGGDWQVKNKDAEPGGWAFEFRNDHYPDVDDTAFILMALQRVKFPDEARMEAATRRGVQWLLSMQNRDGGWAAFDRDNDSNFLCNIPFADHNAMIDPSTADVTARVMECLGRFGWPAEHPAIQRGLKFLLKDQCEDGSWFGRWGVNYVYGTSGVLRALETVSLNAKDYCKRAVNWLKSVQKSDGSFGESLRSYDEPATKGQGVSTPSQTAWGLIGLLAAADPGDPAIAKAAAYLVQQQNNDGSWSESEFTGTGFPCVFYLKYHLYRNSFPVYALARFHNQSRRSQEFRAFLFQPEEFRLRSGF